MLVEKGGLHVLEMWVKKVTKVVRRTVSPQHTDLGPLDCHAAPREEGRELEDREMGVRRGACRRRGAREPRGLRTGGDPGRLYSERWSDAEARRNADQLQAYMTYWAVRWTHCRELWSCVGGSSWRRSCRCNNRRVSPALPCRPRSPWRGLCCRDRPHVGALAAGPVQSHSRRRYVAAPSP